MDECELVTLVSLVACSISKCCSTDEISILAAVFSQLGDTLSTILTKRELDNNNNHSKKADDCDLLQSSSSYEHSKIVTKSSSNILA